MKSLEYVKTHINEFEEDNFLDRRFTKRFLDFIPVEEWGKYEFGVADGVDPKTIKQKEWTEENILKQLHEDVLFGFEKAVNERGTSSALMAMVVNAWCKVLENGLNLNGDDGRYHKRQFTMVAKHYGWELPDDD